MAHRANRGRRGKGALGPVLRVFLLVGLAALGIPQQGDIWAQLWTELERLKGEIPATEAAALTAHLHEALAEVAQDPRGELLRASLDAHQGRDASSIARRLAALEPTPFTPREHWFLADLLPRGPERAEAVLRALEAPSTLARWQSFLAWSTALDGARGLRFEEFALPIQLALHARYQAEWSASDLALTYKSLGEYDEADRILAEAIEREDAAGRIPRNLWEQRGILALGSGDEPRARDYLGKALALGSDDAGLLLSRLDLMAGRTERARAGFRALILGSPPPDWAWRGWGMTLLPPASDRPAAHTPARN
jgi:tetratricopeptide (TPR) repeat protein